MSSTQPFPYHAIRKKRHKAYPLRYQGENTPKNSLLFLYQEKEAVQPPEHPPVKVPQKQSKASHQKAASFFTAYNADVASHPYFFEAVFTARQQVQDGRPLQRLLK